MKKSLLIIGMSMLIPSLSYANMSCYEEADNAEQAEDIGGFDKQAATQSMYDSIQDPSQDLYFCVLQTDFESPSSIIKQCGCQQAVKELCSFDVKDFDISASGGASKAMCAPFAPWAM